MLRSGRSAKEIARELGVTDHTLCNWKAKYSGMDVNDGFGEVTTLDLLQHQAA